MECQRGADQMYQDLMEEHSVLERKMGELLDSKSKLSEILKGAETTRDLLNTQLAEVIKIAESIINLCYSTCGIVFINLIFPENQRKCKALRWVVEA
jgi:hypothetical protein